MTTVYPGGIDSYTTKVDGVDDVMAAHINDLQDAMVAVQTESQLKTLFRVKNTSGITVVANDCGYIDEKGDFKTTTTANLAATWAVVVTGGANNSQVMVCTRGRLLVNYTGTAPSINHFLVTSTTAGSASRQITMRPEIFAVCLANGAGGEVEVQLLTGDQTRYFTSANDLLRINTLSDTDFVATINGAPVGAAVVYNAPTSGTEDTIEPLSSSQDGKIILHNTTRGDAALIESTDVGTNTITLTDNAPGAWANTDDIQARSLTATGAVPGGGYWYDLDLTGIASQLNLARALLLDIQYKDTGAPVGNTFGGVFQFDTYTSFSESNTQTPQTNAYIVKHAEVKLFDGKLCFTCGASGVATGSIILRVRGASHAVS